MLEEMGLTPVWRLRGQDAPAEEPTTAEVAADGPPSAVVAEARPIARHPSPVTDRGDRRGEIMSLAWPALKARVASCTDCPLHTKRNKTVFGVGDEKAEWLFVGEGPGAEEDGQGEPFVGQAGRLLDGMLAA